MRVVGIDWSGARDGGRGKIWSAVSVDGRLRSLEGGRSRAQVAEHLLELAGADPELLVGLDFAFSMPAWFVRSLGAAGGKELWAIAEQEGERWLRDCPPPFFGRKGTRRPSGVEILRRTEREVPAVEGHRPKSVFQIAGGGQVGPGSIRGMPILRRLASEGFRVWPFDRAAAGEPLVVEIYPRLLTGPVTKSDAASRTAHLARFNAEIDPELRRSAAADEDRFDAAISAVVIDDHRRELADLPAGDRTDRLEGRIWDPADAGSSTR